MASQTSRKPRRRDPLNCDISSVSLEDKQTGNIHRFVPIPTSHKRSLRPSCLRVTLLDHFQEATDLLIGRDRAGLWFSWDIYPAPSDQFPLLDVKAGPNGGRALVCDDEVETVTIELATPNSRPKPSRRRSR